jgi:tetratricopeptide (TPR) repeat protein
MSALRRLMSLRLGLHLACAALGAVLCFLPLFSLLGYESGAAAGLGCGLASLLLTLDHLRTGRLQAPLDPARSTSPTESWLLRQPESLALVLWPALLLAANVLRVRNCDPWEGVAFWALIPIPAALLGSGLAWLAAALWPRLGGRLLIALSLVGMDLLHFVLRLITQPPIQGHGLLFGWFAGSIYDEALSLPSSLRWYRLMCALGLLCGMAGLELLWRRQRGLSLRMSAVAVGLTAICFVGLISQRKDLGIGLDRETIARQLGAAVESEHFIIHYDAGSLDADRLQLLVKDHEYRYAEMKAFFEEDPVKWRGRKIRSFIYPDGSRQHRLMGARDTLIARPWTHEMHIRWDQLGDTALAHELSHLFTAPFGGGPLELATQGGLLVNIGLVEGIALAADWPASELDAHEASAAMRRLEMAPDLGRLFRPNGFWSQPGGKAYTLMGSFVRWLVETRGIGHFKQLYRDGDFQAAYGMSSDALISEWEQWLDEQPLDDHRMELAHWRYDKPSIFEKTCARTIAELDRKADAATGRGDLKAAIELRRQLLDLKPRSVQHRIALARLYARQEQWEAALAELQPLLEEERKPSQRAEIQELRGDLLWRAEHTEEAVQAYAECLEVGLDDADRRKLALKLRALSLPFPQDGLARAYLLEEDQRARLLHAALRWQAAAPEDPWVRYLVGFQLGAIEQHEEAVDWLAGPQDLIEEPVIDERRRMRLAESLVALGRLEEAQQIYNGLLMASSTRTRLDAAEGLDRLIFEGRYRPGLQGVELPGR